MHHNQWGMRMNTWKMSDSAPLYALIIVLTPFLVIGGAIYFFW